MDSIRDVTFGVILKLRELIYGTRRGILSSLITWINQVDSFMNGKTMNL